MSSLAKTLVSAPVIRSLLYRHFQSGGPVQVHVAGAWVAGRLFYAGDDALRLELEHYPMEGAWMGLVELSWHGTGGDWLRFGAWGRRTEAGLTLRSPAKVEVPELRAHRRHAAAATRAELRVGGRSYSGKVEDLSIAGAGLDVLAKALPVAQKQEGSLLIVNDAVGRVEVPVRVVSVRPRGSTSHVAVTFAPCEASVRRLLLNHIWYAADPSRYAAAGVAAR